jgi:hypothetical protein
VRGRVGGRLRRRVRAAGLHPGRTGPQRRRHRPGPAAPGHHHRPGHRARPKLLSRVSVRATVTAGFTILAATSLGLLAITATTPLPVTAAILAGRAAAIGLVITPLLDAITSALHPAQLADASTVFNICQRIAGALGIGLIAALFTTWARTHGPVPALHATGLLLTGIAALAAGAAALLPGRRTGPAAAAG